MRLLILSTVGCLVSIAAFAAGNPTAASPAKPSVAPAPATSAAAVVAPANIGFPELNKLQKAGADISALAVRLDHPQVIWQLNAGNSLIPASVSKLYTAAAALEAWGPDHRFKTWLLTTGKVEGNVLKGNLVFLGAGDPTLDEASLWQLVMRLRNNGITSIKGDLIVNESLFGHLNCDDKDRCRAQKTTHNAYNAPLSSAGSNFASWCLEVEPGSRIGEDANIGLCGLRPKSVKITATVKTIAAGKRPQLSLDRATQKDTDELIVKGTIPLDSGRIELYRSVSDAAQYTATLLRESLKEAGIAFNGKVKVTDTPLPMDARSTGDGQLLGGVRLLASINGEPLNYQLSRMLAYSNNYMADVLALGLVAKGADGKGVDLVQAGILLENLAEKANLQQQALLDGFTGSPSFRSGSGLTPENRLAAGDIVALLSHMYHRSDLFPSFLGALSVPKYSPLRKLRKGSETWQERLAVKTGSLNNPVTVASLAGYFRCKDGGWGAFALIVNGSAKQPKLSPAPFDAFYDDMDSLLKQCDKK